MFYFVLHLFFISQATAKPDTAERFPQQFIKLLQQSDWHPTPSKSDRFQVGDVFDFGRNKKVIAGTECFKRLPTPVPMTNMNILNMLRGGLTVPFGVSQGNTKGTRYKKTTFTKIEVTKIPDRKLRKGITKACKQFLQQEISTKPANLQLIKGIIQSQIKQQECTGTAVGFGFNKTSIDADFHQSCSQETNIQVTFAYQLIAVRNIPSLRGKINKKMLKLAAFNIPNPTTSQTKVVAKKTVNFPASVGKINAIIRNGQPKIIGSLDKAVIDKVIKMNLHQLRYCYQREISKKPSLKGKLTVKFVISKTGSVLVASIKNSTMKNKKVESCLVSRFRKMQFPQPTGGGIVIVSYPFTLSRGKR